MWFRRPWTQRERELNRRLVDLRNQAHRVRPNQINHTNSGGHGNYKWTAKEQREWRRLGSLQVQTAKELFAEQERAKEVWAEQQRTKRRELADRWRRRFDRSPS